LELSKELGFEGVEIWDEHFSSALESNKNFIEQLRKKADLLGLPIITIAVNNHEFTSSNAEVRKKDIMTVLHWVRILPDLGCNVLRILPGDLKALNKNEKETYPFAKASLAECVNEAEKKGIYLAVENCPRETDPKVVLKLITDLNSPYLKICADIGNILGNIRYRAFEELLPYAIHVHLKTYEFNPKGEEINIDYQRVMKMLKSVNYDRYGCVEYEGHGNEIEDVRRSLALVKRFL